MHRKIFVIKMSFINYDNYKKNFVKYLGKFYNKVIIEIIAKMDKFKKVYPELNRLTLNYDVDNTSSYNITKKITKKDLQIFYGVITQILFGEKKKLEDIQYFGNYLIELHNEKDNRLEACKKLYKKINGMDYQMFKSPFYNFFTSPLITQYIRDYKLYMIKSTAGKKDYFNGRDYFLKFIPYNEKDIIPVIKTENNSIFKIFKEEDYDYYDYLCSGNDESWKRIRVLDFSTLCFILNRPKVHYLGEQFFRAIGVISKNITEFKNIFSVLNNLTKKYELSNFIRYSSDLNMNVLITEINNDDLQIFFGVITEIIFGEKKEIEELQNVEKWYSNINNTKNLLFGNIKVGSYMFFEDFKKNKKLTKIKYISEYIYNHQLINFKLGIIKRIDEWNKDIYFVSQIVYNEKETIAMLFGEIMLKSMDNCKNKDEHNGYVEILGQCIVEDNKTSIENLLYFPKYGRKYYDVEKSFNEKVNSFN